MTPKFPQVSAIALPIAQLQEQLNKLTDAMPAATPSGNAPLRECEQQVAELLEQVTNHAQLIRDQGIESQSLIDWANQMYLVITGVSVEVLHQEISDLKSDNKLLRLESEQLEKRLIRTGVSMEALHQEITDLKSDKEVLRFEREQLKKRLDIYKQ